MNGKAVRLPDNSYEHFALVYDGAGLDRFSLGLEFRIRRIASDGSVRRIADLACGTGSLLRRLSPLGAEMVGLDASAAMIRKAARKGSGSRFIVGALEALPLEGPFDLLLSVYDSLNYLDSEEALGRVFREALRIAAPGGTFLFDLNDREAYESIWGNPEAFVEETGGGRLTIRSTWSAREGIAEAEVLVEAGEGGEERAWVSRHRQRYHPPESVARALESAGWGSVTRESIDPFPGEEVLPGGKILWLARRTRWRGVGE
ncbi:MAG: class I SAM-dependent methyltransferase [Candidatus Eisenbacteria bacterium]